MNHRINYPLWGLIMRVLSVLLTAGCGGQAPKDSRLSMVPAVAPDAGDTEAHPPAFTSAAKPAVLVAARSTDPNRVRFSEGTFQMGSSSGTRDHRPVHTVRVSAFEISRTEATVAQYAKCVAANQCTPPQSVGFEDERCNWNNGNWQEAHWGNHPVNCVTWQQARDYCTFVNGRLPTEAEWEFAARDGGRVLEYPWGDDALSCALAIVNDQLPGATIYEADHKNDGCGSGRTWPVCSRPKGNTASGLCDMAGNVGELVEDSYNPHWYEAPAASGADVCNREQEDNDKVFRGGAFTDIGSFTRTTDRCFTYIGFADSQLGFRCVWPIASAI